MTRVEIKEFAKKIRNDNIWNFWKGFLIVALAIFIVGFLTTIVSFIPLLGWLAGILLGITTSTFYVGLLRYNIDIVNGYKPNINTIFNYCKSLKEIFTIFLINFLMGLLISCGYIFFIIPGIILTLAYSLSIIIHFAKPEEEVPDLLTLSRKYMKGHKTDLLILNLSFIGWHILSSLTLGILYIWVFPYIVFANTKFFLNILEKNDIIFERDDSTVIKDTFSKIKEEVDGK